MESKSAFKEGGMFEGATPFIFENARNLRKNLTEAEMILWSLLKAGVNDCKIRRQHPIGQYIADFYCHKAKLIIEIDGSVHNDELVKANDIERQNNLETSGYQIIRFSNEEVFKQPEKVLEKIKETVQTLTTSKEIGVKPL